MQTATNSFGPFLLTNLLPPSITDRVVWVTSQLHGRGHLILTDLFWDRRIYRPMEGYSDLSSISCGSLSKFSGASPLSAPRCVPSSRTPGIATTTLAAHSSSNAINRFPSLPDDLEHGALPTLYAATQHVPGNADVGPDGFGSIKGYPKVRKPGRAGLHPTNAARLWNAVSRRVGLDG